MHKMYFAAVIANLQVEGVKTLIDFSTTEISIKGAVQSSFFPYVYYIVFVGITIGILLVLYKVLADVSRNFLRHF